MTSLQKYLKLTFNVVLSWASFVTRDFILDVDYIRKLSQDVALRRYFYCIVWFITLVEHFLLTAFSIGQDKVRTRWDIFIGGEHVSENT